MADARRLPCLYVILSLIMTKYMTKKERAQEVLKRLRRLYTKKKEDFVMWRNPLELVVGTVLSAQCTDKRVNIVVKDLFKKYTSAQDYANADIQTLEKEIYSTGFYRSKAKYLKNIGKIVSEKHNGKVPDNLNDLLKLSGVSNKTAYLVLAKAFKKYEGVAVDTHVKRIAPRLGLTYEQKNPDIISRELGEIFEDRDTLDINEYLILHGRKICLGKPKCGECILKDICPYGKKVSGF